MPVANKSPKGMGITTMKYNYDPYPLKTRFNCKCAKCNCSLPKGNNAFYWPFEKKVYCLSCGHEPYNEFLLTVQDEENFQKQYH